MLTIPGATGAAVLAGLLLAACSSSVPKASGVPLNVVQGTARAGVACHYLAQAEANPAGSAQQVVGSMDLAAAVDYARTASNTDGRWAAFANDMGTIGKPGGQAALDRVTKICHQWGVNPNFYKTHPPVS
jgi:hypothetical protein